MDRTSHWQRVYTTKAETDVSWFETSPAISLQLIEAAGMTAGTCVCWTSAEAIRDWWTPC